MPDFRVDVLLSMQRALWEQVTPDLRGVAVAIVGSMESGSVSARFFSEGSVGVLQAASTSLAETSCTADCGPGVSVAFHAVPHAGRDLVRGEEWVYLRWEPDADD